MRGRRQQEAQAAARTGSPDSNTSRTRSQLVSANFTHTGPELNQLTTHYFLIPIPIPYIIAIAAAALDNARLKTLLVLSGPLV